MKSISTFALGLNDSIVLGKELQRFSLNVIVFVVMADPGKGLQCICLHGEACTGPRFSDSDTRWSFRVTTGSFSLTNIKTYRTSLDVGQEKS